MPLSPDEQIGHQQKRRETSLKVFAVFMSLSAAAVMVFFVGRLISKRVINDRTARAALEHERLDFEATLARDRQLDGKSQDKSPAREIVANPDVVDMSRRGPAPRLEPSSSPRREPVAPEAASPRRYDAPREPAPVTGPGGIDHLDQKQAAIAEVLREFFEARAVAEMLPLVRDARRVRPLMDEYYHRSPIKDRTWKGIGWAVPVEEAGYRFAYVQANFADAQPVNVVVEETDTGFFIDWESSVQYCEIGWKEFMATKPGQPKTFRVIASRADSADGQAALTLKHPQEDGVVVGRFDPSDPRFRPLVEQLDLCKWKDVPVILRLCYPGPDTKGNEVRIAGVEGKGWLILGERLRGS